MVNRAAAAHGYVPQWASARKNQVTGTDGSLFHHPFGDDSITVFQVRPLCLLLMILASKIPVLKEGRGAGVSGAVDCV
jgi:hypothetical protein